MPRASLIVGLSPYIITAQVPTTRRALMSLNQWKTDASSATRSPLRPEKWGFLAGISPEIRPVQKLIAEIATTDIPVLLMGESGTGKEVAALQIHALSIYRDFPFVKLSCSAFMPEKLQAHALGFGIATEESHEKLCGTLFLDEISELDSACQRNLLHAFPEGGPRPSNGALPARIISCTTRDLESEVLEGRFRSELYYRLNGVCVRLPALRRRREDIPLFVEHFLHKYTTIFQRAPRKLSDSTMRLFTEHAWPGNVRELENVIKKIVALDSEELAVSELSVRPAPFVHAHVSVRTKSLKAAARAASQQAEKELILQTLTQTHWNRKRAAEALQISYKSLLYKLKQIQVPDSDEA
jgi:DNA-binding NtrC family response regulator